MRVLAGAAVLGSLGLAVVVVGAVAQVRTGLRLIGHRTGPAVVSTSNLYFALADMDAQVANVLLVGDQRDLGINRQQALAIYDQRRAEVARYLLQTASISGADAAAGDGLRTLLDGFGRYQSLAGQVVLLASGPDARPGRPPEPAMVAYRQATDLMHGEVLPAAAALTRANAAVLGRGYAAVRSSTVAARVRVAGVGVVVLAVLVGAQVFLARRVRRIVNPGLVLATVVVLLGVGAGVRLLSAEAEHLRAAKKDAFDSILALSQARAVGFDANADESRYLLDPARTDRYEQAFLDKSQQLAGFAGATIAGYDQAYAGALAAYRADHRDVRFRGFLGTEMRNITFPGERAAAEEALARYRDYQLADRRIRALARAGDLGEAIRFCTSAAPGDSNYAFDAYDKALGRVIDINRAAFDRTIAAAERDLAWWSLLPWLLALIVAGLVALGFWPRLAEYR